MNPKIRRSGIIDSNGPSNRVARHLVGVDVVEFKGGCLES